MKHFSTSVAAALLAAFSASPTVVAAADSELAQVAVGAHGEFLPASSWQFATSDEVMAQLQLEVSQAVAPGESEDPSSQIEYGDLGW